jgi:hypothetical protein
VFAIAAGAGFAAGVLVAQRRMGQYRRSLFSSRPLDRLAALGYLSGHPGAESVRLLREYLTWETHPLLRRRAAAITRRMEARLA